MDSKKHLYIVSFGDSRQYRYEFISRQQADPVKKEDPFQPFEKELNDYLSEKFPGQTFAFFTTPRAIEVDPSHESRFASYPELNAAAMTDIKRILSEEIRERAALNVQDSNLPSSDFDSPNIF